MQRFSNTWLILRASWELLKKDKEMLIFSLLSGVCCLLVTASFLLPWMTIENGQMLSSYAGAPPNRWELYVLLFLFYFCIYFVMMYFNAAIVACALIRMGGKDPTVADGLRVATARVPLLIGWALISATVGVLIRILEERSRLVGKIVAGMVGMAFTVASSMVIPILVVEKKDALTALKESTALLKETWGEQLISRAGFGLVFFVLSLPAFLLVFLGITSGERPLMFSSLGLALVYLVVLSLAQSTLQGIFQAALYAYARHRMVPAGYDAELLKKAMGPRFLS
ncbi:MAG: DUF6159 family protein [bacterium]